jgi:hypothetical protein
MRTAALAQVRMVAGQSLEALLLGGFGLSHYNGGGGAHGTPYQWMKSVE